MIIPSACAAVAVLATAAKCVDGFSTTSPLLSEGWRRSSSISMAYENESVSAATTVTAVADNEESARRRMLAARLQTQKYESSLSIDQDDDSDEDNSEETTSEVVSIETNEEMMLDLHSTWHRMQKAHAPLHPWAWKRTRPISSGSTSSVN